MINTQQELDRGCSYHRDKISCQLQRKHMVSALLGLFPHSITPVLESGLLLIDVECILRIHDHRSD